MATWTYGTSARRSLATLATIKQSLIRIGGYWGDIDEYLVSRADELLRQIEHYCNLVIRGPVYHRHVKRCRQTDMATKWGEDHRSAETTRRASQERQP